MKDQKINIITNPNAFRGKNTDLLRQVEERLRSVGRAYEVFRTQKKGDATEIARALSEKGEGLVVAMGGDGTLNEVICGIDPAAVTLGLIPAGTGNDFAEAAKIASGLDALELILSGEPKYTDYIECGNGKRSINIAGLGIDVDILERCERMRGSDRGKYYRSLLHSLFRFKAIGMQVTVDGKTEEHRAMIVAACNGSQFGGGIKICPPAVIDDGKLELVVIDCPPRIKFPGYLTKLKQGKVLTLKHAHRFTCDEAVIVPERKGSVQYDGELVETDALRVKIVTKTLKMYRG